MIAPPKITANAIRDTVMASTAPSSCSIRNVLIHARPDSPPHAMGVAAAYGATASRLPRHRRPAIRADVLATYRGVRCW